MKSLVAVYAVLKAGHAHPFILAGSPVAFLVVAGAVLTAPVLRMTKPLKSAMELQHAPLSLSEAGA